MPYIKVDHSKFEAAASAIDKHVSDIKREMQRAQSEVEILSAKWQGDDYMDFRAQWYTINQSSSAHYKMVKSLESYSSYLRNAANQYRSAQENAVNRASWWLRW